MNGNRISLVVLDLAGTVVDYGSRAPAGAFRELFRRHGVVADEAEARGPMGMHKRDHIAMMLDMPGIAAQWRRRFGRDWITADLDALFEEFLPLQLEALPLYAEAIPGVPEALGELRDMGVKIAATTGYNREMTALLVDALAAQGVIFDCTCCAAEVPAGRPQPWMIYRCMEAAVAFPPGGVVNIGDTIADVRAGANAGVRNIGVTMTGNMLGLSREEAEALAPAEAASRHAAAAAAMRAAGADLVLESAAALPGVIRTLETMPPLSGTIRVKKALQDRLPEESLSAAAGISSGR